MTYYSIFKGMVNFFDWRLKIDVKDLSDIPQYWTYMKKLKLPRYQYSFRELSTGLSFTLTVMKITHFMQDCLLCM